MGHGCVDKYIGIARTLRFQWTLPKPRNPENRRGPRARKIIVLRNEKRRIAIAAIDRVTFDASEMKRPDARRINAISLLDDRRQVQTGAPDLAAALLSWIDAYARLWGLAKQAMLFPLLVYESR